MKIKSLPQLFFGGTVLFIGVGFLLDGVGAWNFTELVRDWWPAIIILMGIASLVSNPRTPLWPVFIIGSGALLLLKSIGAVDFQVWQVIWPVAIIMIGLSFFFQQLMPKPKTIEDNQSDIFVLFSGVKTANSSMTYEGGKLNAVFGGIEIDLRDAVIPKQAELDIFTAFGGVEIRVPTEWEVRVSGLPIFGGWENNAKKPSSSKAPVLVIRGTCLFGGVEIKN
jgi:predicted membrane protein